MQVQKTHVESAEARLGWGKRGGVQRWHTDQVHVTSKHQQNRSPGLATSFAQLNPGRYVGLRMRRGEGGREDEGCAR